MGIENIDVLQNLEPVSASTNLDEILLDYHKNVDIIQKECGISNQNNLANFSATAQNEYAHQLALLNIETINTLSTMGYEAYEITAQNYDIMEKLLNTDLSQFSIDREGGFSFLLIIGDEINSEISPMSSVSSEFNYTYQGVTYRMRTVTLTSSDNPAYNKANTVNLINSNSANLINNALNTVVSALVSTVSKTLGYLYSILGINVNAVGTTQAMNLNLQAHSNWTRRYTQVYSTYDKAWANGSCVEFVTCLSYITGTYYNKNLNRAQSCSGQRDTVVYSSNYNNDTWKRNNAVDGFKTGNVRYNLTGDVKYKFGGTVKVTHTENF